MKVLGMYMTKFGYTTSEKSLEEAETIEDSFQIDDVFVAFIQVEESDQERDIKSRDKKLANHIKWCSRKNESKRVVLHSFAHLSESKADASFSKDLLDRVEIRLKNGGYEVYQTPYGYFLNLEMSAPGFSFARLWASL